MTLEGAQQRKAFVDAFDPSRGIAGKKAAEFERRGVETVEAGLDGAGGLIARLSDNFLDGGRGFSVRIAKVTNGQTENVLQLLLAGRDLFRGVSKAEAG